MNISLNEIHNALGGVLHGSDVVLNSVAIDTLSGEPWLVLGAFAELGSESKTIHKQMGKLIKLIGVVRLVAVAPDTESTVQAFGLGATFFPSQQALIDAIKPQLIGNEVILVKGSRVQRMERVTQALTEIVMH